MRMQFMSLAIAAVLAATASQSKAQTIGCTTGGVGGAIPTSGTGGNGTFPNTLPPFELTSPLAVASVPANATCVTEVKLFGLTHTFAGDVQFVLTSPGGQRINLLCRQGGGCDFAGDYVISSFELNQGFPACSGTSLPPSTFSQNYGTFTSGAAGIDNVALSTVAPATGNWTLSVYDWAAIDVGFLTSWDICFGTPPPQPPPGTPPALVGPANGASVFGPIVTLSWNAVAGATGYDVDVDGTITAVAGTSFNFNSTLGGHTWTARAKNTAGAGPWAAPFVFTDIGVAPTPCNGPTLAAGPFIAGNGGAVGGQIFFDINVTKPGGITLSQLQTNTSLTAGLSFGMDIYTKSGTYVGFENNAAAFTLRANGGGLSAGQNQPSLVEFTDFTLPVGTHGVALVMQGAAHSYTNGNGTNQNYSNADLSIAAGKALNTPWAGTPFSPRVWNGVVIYDCNTVPPIVTYCTAGTTTNGCTADISASGQPSVSGATTCTINVADVEGQKSGLIFYSISGQLIQAWNATSFLCVKAPTQRTLTQTSTGTVGQCDGTMTLNWGAFQAANPTAVGNPWTAGNKAQVQAWFRDPPAGKSTNLSNAIELTYVP